MTSSPEVGGLNRSGIHSGPSRNHGLGGQDVIQSVQNLLGSFASGGNFQSFPSNFQNPTRPSPPAQMPDVKPFANIPPPSPHITRPALIVASSASPSIGTGGLSALRLEPPKRLYDIERLPIGIPARDELLRTSLRNLVLLQGDPQIITKQRVETAIRVIVDLLRVIPRSPNTPSLPPDLVCLLPPDSGGGLVCAIERIGTFTAIRMQTGTTTKLSSKKQLQAGPTSIEQVIYLETAVYTSGDNPRRVYPCKRCRAREARRRETKEATRRKRGHADSEAFSNKSSQPRTSAPPPSTDFVTGENPDDYDPHKHDQIVEEPPWDPTKPDWRHEMVLFNTPPELPIKDGSVSWLPLRVVCYGKCHGDKSGFSVHFTFRLPDGSIIAREAMNPIRITDDHKTDVKPKGKENMGTSVTRGHRGRTSIASSSRRQSSVAASEAESLQSEAGPHIRQPPPVRTGRPYERPKKEPSSNTHLPLTADMAAYRQHRSGSSISSVPSMSPMSAPSDGQESWPHPSMDWQGRVSDTHIPSTISPGALRRPTFENHLMMNEPSPISPNSIPSHSSNLSPLSHHDELSMIRDHLQSPTSLVSALAYAQLNEVQASPHHPTTPLMMGDQGGNILGLNAYNDALGSSSRNNSMTSFADDASSFSQPLFEGSVYSQSGLPPNDDSMFSQTSDSQSHNMEQFLDYSGGDDQQILQQPFPTSPLQPQSNQAPLSFDMANFFNPPVGGSHVGHGMSSVSIPQNVDVQRLLEALQRQQPLPPVITRVVPAEGPMTGGSLVAIGGHRLNHQTKIMFGDRPAETQFDGTIGFLTCISPPSSRPGPVDVTVVGVPPAPGTEAPKFVYRGLEPEFTRLALQVQEKQQMFFNASNGQFNWSGTLTQNANGQSNMGQGQGMSYSSSNHQHNVSTDVDQPMSTKNNGVVIDHEVKPSEKQEPDLQTTIFEFLQSLNHKLPGSLRSSDAINTLNESRQSLSHLAASAGFSHLLNEVLSYGAEVDIQDIHGFTPLSYAAYGGHIECVRLLINAKASYDQPTLLGEMPLDLAQLREHDDVIQLLVSEVWQSSSEPITRPEIPDIDLLATIDDHLNERHIESDDHSDISEELEIIQPKPFKHDHLDPMDEILVNRSPPTRRNKSIYSPKHIRTPSPDHPPPPPYASPIHTPINLPRSHQTTSKEENRNGWFNWKLSTISIPSPPSSHIRLPIPNLFGVIDNKSSDGEESGAFKWIPIPLPSWEARHGLPSSEELKMYSQSWAVVLVSLVSPPSPEGRRSDLEGDDVVGSGTTGGKGKVRHTKKTDIMLWIFWLPVLCFFGFWVLITALPIVTTVGLLYFRQVYKALKQRV
ncbi:hypothetical protein TREMEDRAFT_73985 [Tremella mesenterica DSM 1558]|uniref:uncharacterized protein n=1 Tax=Tremella mesenterica (strain ATCC 24925 / CBS 8224 / DSM 1558 / NBRC 9311 / NRRL Y-6157 / RJB 2259-6 / UBC 559-6) TaxID=578456 RepID=UPI0003F49011|nr:uncharacterized protein TREMEDRAFT_73985 [Tremella mesenterica DSM 1558]EIW68975.1 hypothetical protein TREMEDRAFT_73985 [Tremella mesenterica DSM 1558]